MRESLDQCTVVVAGMWNKGIFSPEWVSATLFDNREVGCEVAFAHPHGIQLRLVADNLLVIPNASSLTVGLTRSSDDIKRAATIAAKVTQTLKHTPVIGVGVNFGFDVDEEQAAVLLGPLRTEDESRINGKHYEIKRREIARQIDVGNSILNLRTVVDSSGKATLHFNFHKDCNSAEAASAWLSSVPGLDLRNVALGLLKDVYRLELSDDDSNN